MNKRRRRFALGATLVLAAAAGFVGTHMLLRRESAGCDGGWCDLKNWTGWKSVTGAASLLGGAAMVAFGVDLRGGLRLRLERRALTSSATSARR